MRKLAGIFGVAGLLLCFAAVSFADPPAKNDKKADDSKGKLAEDIFAKADKHNHGFVTKIEFKKADNDLIAAIKQMAIDGTIGRPQPGQRRGDATAAATSNFTGGFADADTDHDKKVTLAEFTDYVSRAVAAADQELQAAALAKGFGTGGGVGRGGGHFGRRESLLYQEMQSRSAPASTSGLFHAPAGNRHFANQQFTNSRRTTICAAANDGSAAQSDGLRRERIAAAARHTHGGSTATALPSPARRFPPPASPAKSLWAA